MVVFGFTRRRVVPSASSGPEVRGEDPMVVAKRLSDVVFDLVVVPAKVQQGVPSPIIAQILGTLAGVSSQFVALSALRDGDPACTGSATPLLTLIGQDGETYLFGDAINRPVLESPHSVWELVGGVTQRMGEPVPDVRAIAAVVMERVGGPDFDRCPDLPPDAPRARDALVLSGLIGRLRHELPTDHLPAVFALAYQRMVQTDHDVDPSVDVVQCARVMMHSAIAMSKLRHDLGALTPTTA
ncbi:hypothetical protein [Amnibacterium kyonggiense]